MDSDIKTVVALIALAEEYSIFKEIFEVVGDRSSGTQVRLEHRSGCNNVRLYSVLSEQMGSQSALFSADKAIADLDPDIVVVVGIAGGISGDLKIGDVCISNEIMDVLHNSKIHEKSNAIDISFAPDFYNIDAELVASFTFLKVHPKYELLFKNWREDALKSREALSLGEMARDGGPDILIGPIACGPVVASDTFNEKLKSLHRKVCAIETESGGIFGRLMQARIPAIAIRGISDLADSKKAELERTSDGAARRLAMLNASRLLREQIANDRFINVAVRYRESKSQAGSGLFPTERSKRSVVAELDEEIRAKLAERSPEFRTKPESFYLPIPRAQRINYADDLAGKELESPEGLISCLKADQRILVRLPRSYPSQALGWSIAHSLIRQQIDNKVVLPYLISGESLNPPSSGFKRNLPSCFFDATYEESVVRVIIIEEPIFHARNRMKFIGEELKKIDAHIMVLTKAEDNIATVEQFIKDNGFKEYELAPVSFSETAFFLEKAFDMTPREAEAVAIRLDDTFRKFRLDAHPTYFAGIQEETLAALINANKRAELIQLAVDALLSLMVAADKSSRSLSRTTRERFLRILVVEMAKSSAPIDDVRLLELATEFLSDGLLPTPAPEFLRPFFEIGLLYRMSSAIYFTHPYLEGYLLAQALREDEKLSEGYFDPDNKVFNYYAFDLYCELGPSDSVIEKLMQFAEKATKDANSAYPNDHAYFDRAHRLTALSSPRQLLSLTTGLMGAAEKMEKDDDDASHVRSEKQRLLDARRYVRSKVGQRNPARQDEDSIPDEIKKEFEILDALSRALSLTGTAIGSGSESLRGEEKVRLGGLVLEVAEKFSDVWTRNRLRVDFESLRNDVLSDENIWNVMEDLSAEDDDFDSVKADLELQIHGFELNTILQPMGRVLWRVSSMAGVGVLQPVLERTQPRTALQSLMKGAWLLDVDAEKGRDALKVALANYHGAPLMRIVLASHLLWRAFWHHYKTAGARHFVNSAKRALRPLSLSPAEERLERIRKGPRG